MTVGQIRRLSEAAVAATFGLVVGLLIVLRGASFSLAMGLLPILAALAVFIIANPVYFGFFLIIAFYTNLESLLALIMNMHLGDVLFGVSVGYIALLFFLRSKRLPFSLPVRTFFLFFVVVAVIIAISPTTREFALINWTKRTLYALNTFIVTYLTISTLKRLKTITFLITWAGAILSIINMIEFYDRSIIDFSTLPGRSAGLLLNPNVSAAAILACIVISYLYPPRGVIILRVLMFAGIYTTFSRFALVLFWPLVAYLELRARKLSLKQAVFSGILVTGIVLVTTYSAVLIEDFSTEQVQKASSRIAYIKKGRFDDASSRHRVRVIFVNLERFRQHPLIGGGLGSASTVDSPHNQFLLLMAEQGILALLAYLLFLTVLFLRLLRLEPKRERQILLVTFAYAVSYLLFTHNALSLQFHTILLALLCATTEIYPSKGPFLAPIVLGTVPPPPDERSLAISTLKPSPGPVFDTQPAGRSHVRNSSSLSPGRPGAEPGTSE